MPLVSSSRPVRITAAAGGSSGNSHLRRKPAATPAMVTQAQIEIMELTAFCTASMSVTCFPEGWSAPAER